MLILFAVLFHLNLALSPLRPGASSSKAPSGKGPAASNNAHTTAHATAHATAVEQESQSFSGFWTAVYPHFLPSGKGYAQSMELFEFVHNGDQISATKILGDNAVPRNQPTFMVTLTKDSRGFQLKGQMHYAEMSFKKPRWHQVTGYATTKGNLVLNHQIARYPPANYFKVPPSVTREKIDHAIRTVGGPPDGLGNVNNAAVLRALNLPTQ